MQIINLKKSDILTFDDFITPAAAEAPLEKALFKHAYYSHLVPQQIMGKDGVKRIHWVNPNKDAKDAKDGDKKKPKLNLVAHFHEGEREQHHKQITADNEIDLDHVHHFSHGDKVRVTRGKYKGQVGVFAGSYTTSGNTSPRTSIKFHDPAKNEWRTADPVGVNSIELVHRANDQTREAVAPKSVEHVTRKGTTTTVSKTWKDTRKDTTPNESPQARHERLGKEIAKGILFKRAADGAMVYVVDEKDDRIHVKILNAPKGAKSEGLVEKDRFTKMVADGTYNRAGMSKLGADTAKKNTRLLETGELHTTGKITYDKHGQPELDAEIAKDIIFENWDFIDRVIQGEVARFPSVDPTEVSGVDMFDKIRNAVNTFEPYLNSSLQGRLHQYVKDAAYKKASQIHQLNVLRERKDMLNDRTDDPDGVTVEQEPEGTTDNIGGGGFVNKLDALVFEDALADEADMMRWIADNDEYADVLMRMTGLGVGEASITNQEAAKELHGKLLDADGKPYALNTIVSRLSRMHTKIVDAFHDEAEKDPHFAHSLRQSIQYRSKMRRKRDIAESDAKDFPTIKAVLKKYDGGRNARSAIAAKLIKHGSSIEDTPKLVETVERIMEGRLVPHDYRNTIKSEAHAKILEDTLKDMLPDTAVKKIPDRFKIVQWQKFEPKAGKSSSLRWLNYGAGTVAGK